MPGIVAHELARNLPSLGPTSTEIQVVIENPVGILSATIDGQRINQVTKIDRAAYKRSAQILLRGYAPLYRASGALKEALSTLASDCSA